MPHKLKICSAVMAITHIEIIGVAYSIESAVDFVGRPSTILG
jgi:hypothetical protein